MYWGCSDKAAAALSAAEPNLINCSTLLQTLQGTGRKGPVVTSRRLENRRPVESHQKQPGGSQCPFAIASNELNFNACNKPITITLDCICLLQTLPPTR